MGAGSVRQVWSIGERSKEKENHAMKLRLWLAIMLAVMLAALIAPPSYAIDLYSGPLGTPPEDQGWLVYGGVGGTVVRTTAGGKTTFDTTSTNTIQAGYSNYFGPAPLNPNFPALNRTDGFIVSLDMRLLSESHANNNRTGVSLIALASDLQGVELSFWTNEIWVQSGPDFLHAEGTAFDTTAAMTTYDLEIHGSTYALRANGNPILSGNLRNYSTFGQPYNLPNFMFLGDDTSSARGSFEFSRLAVVPEPGMFAVMGLAAQIAFQRRRRTTRGWGVSPMRNCQATPTDS